MTRVHQESMINLHNRSSDLCHKKSLFPCLFPLSHVLAIIISYIPFESLKSLLEIVLQNVLAVSSPLAGVSYYKMYYGLLESKLFIILTKYISLERSESQYSIFGGYFVIDVILREKLIDL